MTDSRNLYDFRTPKLKVCPNRRAGSRPPLAMYTPPEIRSIAIQSRVTGHSPRIGMAKIAVITGASAAKAEPFDAPRMLTARP
jgi:hypothetical protein